MLHDHQQHLQVLVYIKKSQGSKIFEVEPASSALELSEANLGEPMVHLDMVGQKGPLPHGCAPPTGGCAPPLPGVFPKVFWRGNNFRVMIAEKLAHEDTMARLHNIGGTSVYHSFVGVCCLAGRSHDYYNCPSWPPCPGPARPALTAD